MKQRAEQFRFGREVQHLAKAFQRLADENLAKEGLTLSQLRVIATISRRSPEALYQKELEEVLGVRRSSVTSLLQHMEKSGLLMREGHGDDKRLKTLALTEKGKKLDENLKTFIHSLEEDLMKGFSETEKDTLSDFLLRMGENLEEIERSRT